MDTKEFCFSEIDVKSNHLKLQWQGRHTKAELQIAVIWGKQFKRTVGFLTL